MSFCVTCVHNRKENLVWHKQRCQHPDLIRRKILNPITGIITYLTTEIEKYPLCRDVNHGNCLHYEAKKDGRKKNGRKKSKKLKGEK